MMPGWLGWTIGYAAVIWGSDAAYGLLEPWLNRANPHAQEFAAGVRFVIPLGVAFLIGLRLQAWWWALIPFLVIAVTMLGFAIVDYLRRSPSQRQQVAAGLILATLATIIEAALATLAAVAGVAIGRWWQGAGVATLSVFDPICRASDTRPLRSWPSDLSIPR